MISRIEALNFRSLRYVAQDMGPFHALVGPNASGKTTFLDVIGFLQDLMSNDVMQAMERRGVSRIDELYWNGQGDSFELAVESDIPEHLRRSHDTIRYEVRIGMAEDEPGVQEERLYLKNKSQSLPEYPSFFPLLKNFMPTTVMPGKGRPAGALTVLTKSSGKDNFYSEDKTSWRHQIQLGTKRTALSNLYADESKVPISLWFKRLLAEGVQTFILNSQELRKPSSPYLRKGFRTDGSNLPWVIASLGKKDPASFQRWLGHLRTALPDIETISTVEREEDKHCYLKIHYKGGGVVPSWLVSDGTLRLLALTLPAYLEDIEGIYLIEEPENGVHPAAVKTITDSLQSVYSAQVLLATHSPIILGELSLDKVLCFAKTREQGTDIVSGSKHPKLQEWRGAPGLDTLFAAGVLG